MTSPLSTFPSNARQASMECYHIVLIRLGARQKLRVAFSVNHESRLDGIGQHQTTELTFDPESVGSNTGYR